MNRLGRNHDGYHGEPLDLAAVHAATAAAAAHGWSVETIATIHADAIIGCQRTGADDQRRVYLSAGIHGDEPAGPHALRELLAANQWPAHTGLWLCPCLNPAGFRLNRRENADGVDLNRDYLHQRSLEICRHTEWLQRQPDFDLTICLHEDWEAHGFYLYELNPDGRSSAAEAVITAVSTVCPIDPSPEIDGRPAVNGIIRPNLAAATRPLWPEAFYLLQHKTRHSYTLEAPSDFPLPVRVAALVRAVRVLLDGNLGIR